MAASLGATTDMNTGLDVKLQMVYTCCPFYIPRFALFRSLFVSLLLAVLAGCATQATIQPSSPPGEQIPPGQGSVAFRLSVSGPNISMFFQFWHEVTVRSIGPGVEEKTYNVAMSPLGAASSATYFGALPPGQYRIAAFSSMNCGAICLTSNVNFDRNGPTFTVEGGKITYLGNLIYLQSDANRTALLGNPVIDEDNFRRWREAYYPALATLPVRVEPQGKAAVYGLVQDMTEGFTGGTTAPDGAVLFAGMSGSIRVVTWPAAGRSVNTGLMSRAHAILPLGPSHWLVAGDFGEVRETTDGGATWQPGRLGLPYGAIRSLLRGKGDELIAFIQQKDTLDVYAGKAGGPWEKLSATSYRMSFKGGLNTPMVKPLADGRRAMVLVPPDRSFLLDLETHASTPLAFPGGVVSAALSGDNVLRCRCNRSGMWVSTWDSGDLGKSWQDSTLDRYLPLPHYQSAQTGFNTQGANIVRTADGGKTWQKVYAQDQPYWPYVLVSYEFQFLFVDDRRMLATDGLSTLLASDDGGATWAAVKFRR